MYMEFNYSSTDKTNARNNQQQQLGMINFKPFNKLIMMSENKKPAPSP